MIEKNIPMPDRIRRIPSGFGWVDHRFVREGHVRMLSRESLVLYLFLVTVADGNGISWYSDEKLCQLTGLTAQELADARKQLAGRSLAAYRRPVYQVLDLPSSDTVLPVSASVMEESMGTMRLGGPRSVGDILNLFAQGGAK